MNERVGGDDGMILTAENWSTGRKNLCSVGGRWMNDYGALVEWYWQRKTEVLGRKPISVPHHHTSLMRGQEVMPELWNHLNLINVKKAFIELYLILYVNACPILMNASLPLYAECAVLCDKDEMRYALNGGCTVKHNCVLLLLLHRAFRYHTIKHDNTANTPSANRRKSGYAATSTHFYQY
jgi:hypothetical protein